MQKICNAMFITKSLWVLHATVSLFDKPTQEFEMYLKVKAHLKECAVNLQKQTTFTEGKLHF